MNHLHIVIDESGSMSRAASTIYEGAAELIDGVSQDGTVCLTRFNDVVTLGEDMQKVSARDAFCERSCQGSTALYDAMSAAMKKALEDHQSEEHVTIAIVTDGCENSSRISNLDQVRSLVEAVKSKSWRVLFIGSNQDAVLTAEGMGIDRGQALTYGNTVTDIRQAFRVVSAANSRYTRGDAGNFTNVERQMSNSGRNDLSTNGVSPRSVSLPSRTSINSSFKWISVDPRTGRVMEYDSTVSNMLSGALSRGDSIVPIAAYSATIYLSGTGRHVQKTINGERDVRRVHAGDTIYTSSFGSNGYRITESGTPVLVQ